MISGARAALLAFLLSTISLRAAIPTLEAIYPPGAARGSSNLITFTGKFEPWPPKVWVSGSGLEFFAETNKGKFTLTISNSAAAGPRLVRVYNEDGVSEPRFFVVGEGKEINDSEPNNHFAQAQRIGELPVTINGRLDKSGDVDSFALHLRVNEWLDARVDSYTMMSKLDGVLRLVTTNGEQLAWNHDFATLDPRLIWRATNDGTFVLQMFGFQHPATSDVKLYGAESAFYRLKIAAFGRDPLQDYPETTAPLLLEDNAVMLTNIEQRHEFTATTDQFLQVKVAATVLGSPLDAWVKVEDSAGKELARNDDAEGGRDPALEWRPPTNGTYQAVVGSFTHRSGPDHRYRLTIQQLGPDFRGTLAVNSLVVTPDSTNTIKLNVKRLRGHTNELIAHAGNLPEGIIGVTTNVPSSGGEMNLQLLAATNAVPFSGPVEIQLRDNATRQLRVVPFMLTSRTEDNGVPGGYSSLLIDHLDHLWLTVKPKPPEKPKETERNK